MSIKIIFLIVFLFVIASLGSALFHMVKNKGQEQSAKTAKSLTYRIALSLVLFIMLYIAFATGMIKPEGIGAKIKMQQAKQTETTTP